MLPRTITLSKMPVNTVVEPAGWSLIQNGKITPENLTWAQLLPVIPHDFLFVALFTTADELLVLQNYTHYTFVVDTLTATGSLQNDEAARIEAIHAHYKVEEQNQAALLTGRILLVKEISHLSTSTITTERQQALVDGVNAPHRSWFLIEIEKTIAIALGAGNHSTDPTHARLRDISTLVGGLFFSETMGVDPLSGNPKNLISYIANDNIESLSETRLDERTASIKIALEVCRTNGKQWVDDTTSDSAIVAQIKAADAEAFPPPAPKPAVGVQV